MDALHDHHHKGKVIWDFSQQMMVHSSKASSSKSPSPFSLSNEYGLVMSEYHRDTNQKSVQQKMKVLKVNMDINITNDNIIKAQWTPEQDIPPKSWKQMVGNCEKVAGRPEKTIKNHWNTTKGSLLHAYIKKVNVAEEATKECKIEE
ncbi:hypothetical protein JHK85_052761 [Glycine max]|nr:hypothetical protein JHK85_052761 [Glycine max]